MEDYSAARHKMVEEQLRGRGIGDASVLRIMNTVPRHRFVPAELVDSAYEDRPLKIGLGQTISQPYMVAAMTEQLHLRPEHRVLEIGTGSGYQTAILSYLAREVISMERHPQLADRARGLLQDLGCENVQVISGDGTKGWPAGAPYDRILITAGAPEPPPTLIAQLGPGGELLCPAGTQQRQQLIRVLRTPEGIRRQSGMECIFVPLIGEEGWQDPD